MASNTSNLGLLKKDPLTDGKDTFNIRTMLNENWDKIDEFAGKTIPISRGGTGATTAEQALANLGGIAAGAVGNLHVWERVQTYADPVPEVPAGYTLGEVEENVVLASRKTTISTTGAFYYYYGDSVTVKNDGTVNAPSSDSWAEIGRDVSATTIKSGPLFVKGSSSYISSGSGHQAVDVTNEATKVFYIPSGGTLSVTVDSNAKMCYVVATKYQPVIGYPYTPAIPAGTTTDYLTSTDRNAYPDSVTDAQDAYYTLGDIYNNSVYLGYDSSSKLSSICIADNVTVTEDGYVNLADPSSITIGYGGTVNFEDASTFFSRVSGKFIYFYAKGGMPPSLPMLPQEVVYFVPTSASLTKVDEDSLTYYVLSGYQEVTGHAAIPANTTITYLGQLGGRAQIEVGSYVGTGTYGSSNPCSVSASFPIKRLSVFGEIYANTGNYFPIYIATGYSSYSMYDILLTTSFASRRGIHNGASNYGLNYSFGKKSADGKTFSWYSSGDAASFQLNESGSIYYYIAIG